MTDEAKYELIPVDAEDVISRIAEDVGYRPATLYRIRALREIQLFRTGTIIESGTLGGYVESEDNLSQEDEAWIDYDSAVVEKAHVSGEAHIQDFSTIAGGADITGSAKVKGHSVVKGNAFVGDYADVSEYSTVDDSATVKGIATVLSSAVNGSAVVDYATVILSTVSDHATVCAKSIIISCRVHGAARIADKTITDCQEIDENTDFRTTQQDDAADTAQNTMDPSVEQLTVDPTAYGITSKSTRICGFKLNNGHPCQNRVKATSGRCRTGHIVRPNTFK